MEKLPCVLFLLDPLFPFNIFEYYTSNKQIDRLSVNQKGGSQGILSTKEFIIPYFLSQTCIKTIKIWPPQQWNVLFKWWRGCNMKKLKKKHLLKNVATRIIQVSVNTIILVFNNCLKGQVLIISEQFINHKTEDCFWILIWWVLVFLMTEKGSV